jgi:aminoglycoside phosphotransferase (APT) family kinase protein
MTAPAAPSGRPAADVAIDAALARALLAAQHPDLAHLPLRDEGGGWDNVIFRLGDALALRLPRRRIAAWLIRTEQRWLPKLAPHLPLPVPAPVRTGRPSAGYPYRWSITPWLDGAPADLAPPGAGEGPALAGFLAALHRPAPLTAPFNPYRGVPLKRRVKRFEARLASLRPRGFELPAAMRGLWEAALAAPIDAPRRWTHGDLHGRNVLTRDSRLAAVIDWGDLAAGDPAVDLAAVWMLLPGLADRVAAMAAYPASAATWTRARGWALHMAIMVGVGDLAADPRMATMGAAILARLAEGP